VSDEPVNDLIDDSIGVRIFSSMSKFIIGDSLKRSVYTYIISKKLYTESNNELLKLFRECDINNDGKIDAEELLISYGKYFPGAPEEQMEKINEFISRVDINNSGYIEYAEFLTINNILNQTLNKTLLKGVFDFFDVNGNGTIQKDDLKEIFEDFEIEDDKIRAMVREFDKDNDQHITYNEFYEILTSYLEDERKPEPLKPEEIEKEDRQDLKTDEVEQLLNEEISGEL